MQLYLRTKTILLKRFFTQIYLGKIFLRKNTWFLQWIFRKCICLSKEHNAELAKIILLYYFSSILEFISSKSINNQNKKSVHFF